MLVNLPIGLTFWFALNSAFDWDSLFFFSFSFNKLLAFPLITRIKFPFSSHLSKCLVINCMLNSVRCGLDYLLYFILLVAMGKLSLEKEFEIILIFFIKSCKSIEKLEKEF